MWTETYAILVPMVDDELQPKVQRATARGIFIGYVVPSTCVLVGKSLQTKISQEGRSRMLFLFCPIKYSISPGFGTN